MLIGAMTYFYSATIGVIIMLAIWFIDGALVAFIFGGEEEPPDLKINYYLLHNSFDPGIYYHMPYPW